MELTDADRERIEQEAKEYGRIFRQAFIEGVEYATIYERQQWKEWRAEAEAKIIEYGKFVSDVEAERTELLSKLQERLDRCRKVSGYSSGFSDIHNEIDFLDLLLNSLKTK